MAHLLRGKQAGVQADLSVNIVSDSFIIDDIYRYGINSQISAIAYDPIQSLIAVGTNDTKFGPGQIHVFGQKRVSVVLELPRKTSVKNLHFCADKLICIDVRGEIFLFSLETKKMYAKYIPAGTIYSICCDPSIDYLLFGMQSGDVLAYDMDRAKLAPFKLPNFCKEYDPRSRSSPVEALALHPRDVGTLLIGYAEGAVIYSFKQNKPLRYYHYEIPRGAPGGDANQAAMNVVRHPRLIHATWHPTGTFILTAHEDGSLVFWDTLKDGRVVLARTLTEVDIDKPTSRYQGPADAGHKEPIRKIVWCANQDPEDTAILISGGASSTSPSNGLTLLELGRTPVYSTSSWQILSGYLANPKRQRMLPVPIGTNVIDFTLLPSSTPYYDGAHDPLAIIASLGSGEIITMSFPSGYPISPSNQLHLSTTFVHPFINAVNLSTVERETWLKFVEKRDKGPSLLVGGAESVRLSKNIEQRNIVQAAHADGIIRLWDAGHGDLIENDTICQVDLERTITHNDGVQVTKMSLAGATGEFSVGTRTGELVIFRWGSNKFVGREQQDPGDKPRPGEIVDISSRADRRLKEGFCPHILLDMQSGPVTAVKNSDVGFIAVAYQSGLMIVIDMRGPAIIFKANIQEFDATPKLSSGFSRKSNRHSVQGDYITFLEFSVMTLEDEAYSSILLHAGTAHGLVHTLKILPEQGGRYGVRFAGTIPVDNDRVIHIAPINAEKPMPALATQTAVGSLRSGARTNGALVIVTSSGCRVTKPPTSKGAHKTWDNWVVQSAGVTSAGSNRGIALVTASDEGHIRAYTLPGLKEIGLLKVDSFFDPRRIGEAIITPTGDMFGWKSPGEAALINVWARGVDLTESKDLLWNSNLLIPPRPTISNVEWLSGTQHVTPVDLDMLIGGPDRPPSKRMLEQMKADQSQISAAGAASATRSGQQQEGYWEYMQRQITERTEKLGTMQDNMNALEDASSSWAESAGKFVKNQKRNLVMGAVKGKLGF